jgi:hypothetical protein
MYGQPYITRAEIPNLTQLFGNAQNSWNNPLPDDLYIRRVPKNIFSGGAFVGNVGTGLDTLLSLVLPANTMRNDNEFFRGTFGGGLSAGGTNDDDKRIQLSFGGNVLFNTGLIDLDQFGFWIDLLLHRRSNTTFNYTVNLNVGQLVFNSTPAVVTSPGSIITAREGNIITLSGGTTFTGNDQTILLEAESAAAVDNNIFVHNWSVELTRF